MVTISAVPGRVRLHCPVLTGRRGLCQHVRAHVRNLEGVIESEANHRTGRLLVVYDISRTEHELLLSEVQLILGGARQTGLLLQRHFATPQEAGEVDEVQSRLSNFVRAATLAGLRTVLPQPWVTLLPAAVELMRRSTS